MNKTKTSPETPKGIDHFLRWSNRFPEIRMVHESEYPRITNGLVHEILVETGEDGSTLRGLVVPVDQLATITGYTLGHIRNRILGLGSPDTRRGRPVAERHATLHWQIGAYRGLIPPPVYAVPYRPVTYYVTALSAVAILRASRLTSRGGTLRVGSKVTPDEAIGMIDRCLRETTGSGIPGFWGHETQPDMPGFGSASTQKGDHTSGRVETPETPEQAANPPSCVDLRAIIKDMVDKEIDRRIREGSLAGATAAPTSGSVDGLAPLRELLGKKFPHASNPGFDRSKLGFLVGATGGYEADLPEEILRSARLGKDLMDRWKVLPGVVGRTIDRLRYEGRTKPKELDGASKAIHAALAPVVDLPGIPLVVGFASYFAWGDQIPDDLPQMNYWHADTRTGWEMAALLDATIPGGILGPAIEEVGE